MEGSILHGEVVWKFIHTVTREEMCMVFSLTSLGTVLLEKNIAFHFESIAFDLHCPTIEHICLLPPILVGHRHNYLENLSNLVET